MPAETIQRARAYLERRAAELSIPEIVTRVETAAAEVHAAARAIPADAFARAPAPGEWSAEECLAHLVEWQVRNARQVLYVALAGELPEDEAVQLPRGAEPLIAKHGEALESLFAHVREADPNAFLEVTWEHPFFGPLNWRQWLLFLELHCRDHTGQLRALAGA